MDYKKRLKELDITVKFLANKIGISQTMMSYYVNDTRTPPEDIAKKMKDILKAVERIA